MTQATKKIPFEEYLNLDAEGWTQLDLPEGRCEYVAGDLSKVPSESELNDWIARYLFLLLANAGVVSARLIAIHTCEIEVLGKPQTRFPDLVVLREEHLKLTQRRLFITLEMPLPQLVAEVFSPGDRNQERDYTDKRQQYQERGIPEYWLIDPEYQSITVLKLQNGKYVEVGRFQGDNQIESPTFSSLSLTAKQIFAVH